ncbi:MAG: TonB family protein [Pyrinomonadaceae bacterium]|nr:TonB family protein [Pyrinomonadaceae bacterium]
MKQALTFALVFFCLALGLNRSSFAQDNASQTPISVVAASGNREQDRLNGPVRRVRVETAKILPKDGTWVEGSREVLGITTYDPAGRKIDSIAYPVEGSTLSGREQYLYDDKGNVVEMILRSTDGSMLSKESYKYEFDQLGNWTKMSSSVAVFENGKISFEPNAITYRAISYYYNQAIEKLNAPSAKSKVVSAPRTSSRRRPDSNASSTDSTRSSIPTAQASTTIQPLLDSANAHAKTEPVTPPAMVAPAKSGMPSLESPIATSGEIRTIADKAPATSVVQHVAEEVLRKAAIELPKPEYSDAALLARASGEVKVQILVDENGHVTKAEATSGHPLLGAAAEAAARKARFSLTKVSSGATKVYGVISYDFTPPAAATETFPASNSTTGKNPPKLEDRNTEARPTPETGAVGDLKPTASSNHSETARSFYNKGVALQAAGSYADAAEAFNQTVKLDPNDAKAYARLAMAYSALQKHKDAIVVYKMALQTNPGVLDALTYYMWGHSYLALDKTSEAVAAFKRALYITRAEAIDLEQKETSRYPSLEQLHYGMGLAYLNSKRFDKAITELKQVVTLNSKNAGAYYGLAIAHFSNGNRREAEVQQKILTSLDSALAQKLTSALAVAGPPPGCRTIACRR